MFGLIAASSWKSARIVDTVCANASTGMPVRSASCCIAATAVAMFEACVTSSRELSDVAGSPPTWARRAEVSRALAEITAPDAPR